MKEKFQKFENGYLFVDLLVIGSILYYLKSKNYNLIPIEIIVVGIIMYIVMYHNGTKVINRSNENVFVKDEDSDEVSIVPSGRLKNNIDGVRVNGKVYKLPDGVRATITKKGKVFVSSIIGTIIYKVSGGELKSAPDPSWNKLFNA